MKHRIRAALAAAALVLLPFPGRAHAQKPPAEGTYDISAVDQPPQVLNGREIGRMLEAMYPPALRDAGVSGEVTLRFRVLESGKVDSASVTVVRSAQPEFDVPAVHAVRRLVMRPARVDGRPVRTWVEVPIQFHVAAADSAAAAPPRP